MQTNCLGNWKSISSPLLAEMLYHLLESEQVFLPQLSLLSAGTLFALCRLYFSLFVKFGYSQLVTLRWKSVRRKRGFWTIGRRRGGCFRKESVEIASAGKGPWYIMTFGCSALQCCGGCDASLRGIRCSETSSQKYCWCRGLLFRYRHHAVIKPAVSRYLLCDGRQRRLSGLLRSWELFWQFRLGTYWLTINS